MSSKVLSKEEFITLDKGLKFVLPKKLDKFYTFIDVHKFIRKINIQWYLASNPCERFDRAATSGTVHLGLSNPSLFNPPVPVAPAVSIFKDLVLSDLAQLPIKKTYSHPLFQAGLKLLSENKDIVIGPADKGGGIVILDKTDYEREM